jgi:hypothetical protein
MSTKAVRAPVAHESPKTTTCAADAEVAAASSRSASIEARA